ncbi:MAG: DNA-directed RNA polymerase subunit omega [Clostridia bacterium]|nr:DNA-directed RNA polymerase subunit omega [Clostridia bacterium]
MLNQDLSKILSGNISRYSLVAATAKRAREISDKNLEDKVITTEKAVSLALNDFLNDKYKIVEPEEIANI